MRIFVLLFLLILALNAKPAYTQAEFTAASFDGLAWTITARADLDSTAWSEDYEATRARSKELAWELNNASGWLDACRESWEDSHFEDHETGVLSLHDLQGGDVLVEAMCSFGAYQGESALIVVSDSSATLLRYPWVSENSQRSDSSAAIHAGWFGFDNLAENEFTVFVKSRGAGGCGIFTTYALHDTMVVPVMARAQSCDVYCDDEFNCMDPSTWPVVYSTD